MNQVEAEDMICRAVADLAATISKCESLLRAGNLTQLAQVTAAVVLAAEQLGMTKLKAVADQTLDCVHNNDRVAIAATLSRLIRVGDVSLCAVWDVEGLSV
ncbi:MAG: hypothetical protein AB3N23_04760 [Paracoccaceae bacterium]